MVLIENGESPWNRFLCSGKMKKKVSRKSDIWLLDIKI
jgi:hypothetical protein